MRVGTRASKLARRQTDIVVERIKLHFPDLAIEVIPLTTRGDSQRDRPIADLGATGVFVKELEEALLAHEVDLVVHSLKDLPTDIPGKLTLAAVLQREDPRDVLVTRDGLTFEQLPPNARVATSSRRRAAQLAEIRKDITFIDIRGNIDTRLRKLDEDFCEATLLAHAGLLRLGLTEKVSQIFDPSVLTPAAGQGALAVECRADDLSLLEKLVHLEDRNVRAEITCERSFLYELGGGCSVPIGVLAHADGDKLEVTGCIAALDGKQVYRMQHEGNLSAASLIGKELAMKMLDSGARPLVDELKLTVPNKISPP
ncbi:MAG: hydroxymethylbilane synthase [Candidatus Obscuribacterales bacterium]|nr:hydroxymethylbilane synthase [Candidatus Obscuribacterales bacterium]